MSDDSDFYGAVFEERYNLGERSSRCPTCRRLVDRHAEWCDEPTSSRAGGDS